MALIKLKVFCFCLSYWLLNIIDFVCCLSFRLDLLSRNLSKDPLNLSTMEHENISFCGNFVLFVWKHGCYVKQSICIGRVWVIWYARDSKYNKWTEFFHLILAIYEYKNIWAMNGWQFLFTHTFSDIQRH